MHLDYTTAVHLTSIRIRSSSDSGSRVASANPKRNVTSVRGGSMVAYNSSRATREHDNISRPMRVGGTRQIEDKGKPKDTQAYLAGFLIA